VTLSGPGGHFGDALSNCWQFIDIFATDEASVQEDMDAASYRTVNGVTTITTRVDVLNYMYSASN